MFYLKSIFGIIVFSLVGTTFTTIGFHLALNDFAFQRYIHPSIVQIILPDQQYKNQYDELEAQIPNLWPEETPRDPNWKNSTAYFNYLAQFNSFSYPPLLIIRDDEYCQQREIYLSNNPPNSSHPTTFFTDMPSHTLGYKIFTEVGEITMDGFEQEGKAVRLDLDIDLLWTMQSYYSQYYEIGSQFLCSRQRYNHIPGLEIITQKDQIYQTAVKYARRYQQIGWYHSWDYIPKTYIMSNEGDCLSAMSELKTSEPGTWASKPIKRTFDSKVIQLMDEQLEQLLVQYDYGRQCSYSRQQLMVQKYIANRRLVKNANMMIRGFMVVASVNPLIVLFSDGIATVSHAGDSEGQRRAWEEKLTYQALETELKQEGVVDDQWLSNIVRPGLLRHTLHLTRQIALSDKILRHPAVFELLALDFIIDTSDHLWLLDVISSPSLSEYSEDIKQAMTNLMTSLIDMQLALNSEDGYRFDTIVNESQMHWVYDGRLDGGDRYAGLLDPGCY